MTHENNNVRLWILIKGCTLVPEGVDAVERKDVDGRYLGGMTYDFTLMEAMIERRSDNELYNRLENTRGLTRTEVSNEIKNIAQFADKNQYKTLMIYYTGAAERDTGNWIFSDGAFEVDAVLTAIKSTNFRGEIHFYLDSCYAGNWALDIRRFKSRRSWHIIVNAATYPHKEAYDTKDGGLFTIYNSKRKMGEYTTPGIKHLIWCRSHLHNGQFKITYYKATTDIHPHPSQPSRCGIM